MKEALASPKDAALNLALTALVNCWTEPGNEQYEYELKAIDAIKAALAQPEKEPVVWMYQDKSTHEVRFQKHMRSFVDHGQTYETPLYTSPPQRQWVGLTDDEAQQAFKRHNCDISKDLAGILARAIEAKLKAKNGFPQEEKNT